MPVPTVPAPGLDWERKAWRAACQVVAGVDEVGRGAWAGPIVAAAVVLPVEPAVRSRLTRYLRCAGVSVRDSKVMTADQRERVVSVLTQLEIEASVCALSAPEIDAIGLGAANRAVLAGAVKGLGAVPDHVLVDAFPIPGLPCGHDAIVRGDSISVSIALASIVAKVHRDTIMRNLCVQWPQFGFSAHKGYGTAQHRAALLAHGVTEHHRRSFQPIKDLCGYEPYRR